MNALVQRFAIGEPQTPSALQLRLSAKGLLAGVRQAFTHHGETGVHHQSLQQLPAAAAPAAQGTLHLDAPGTAPSTPCVPAGHDSLANHTSHARRVRAGVVRHALSQRPAWTMERIELREANDVFRRHQRALGKLHGHEVAVGVARTCDGTLAGAAVASKPRLECLDDALTAELRGIAVADDVPGGASLLLAAISRAALECGFRRLVWRKKADVVPFELIRAGWDRMPEGCLEASSGEEFAMWVKVLREHEWLR